ncbi:ankyrin repeat and zinc finger domain-containing protein 1 [Electrophorus electricus]|uniref:ankyrin repeat and zinc finger domain-containing protein 1 n=1 Tax=Electrophorus electricus TaxID=8005 RepID=UPI0015D058CC|nr:ankyrin repeat and zinc finger domain-containing protein 1 [Electrophorus electricus]XP_026861458.2 ankyrin repeat and zinc finger domain-containing protein 1 [Electrophorus electricus]
MATQRSLFDLASDLKLTDGLREIINPPRHGETLSTPEPSALEGFPGERSVCSRLKGAASQGDASHSMLCSACQCALVGREEQMEHYKLDWHRFNLKQRLAGRPPFTVEEFEKKTGAGDMSSISGSDSEDDESDSPEGEEVTCEGRDSSRLSSRVVLQNSEGQYMSLYRRAVQSSRVEGEVNLVDSLLKVSDKTVWLILMTGGGHFAGAVFQGKEVLQHKTFHRYTVRAKRGTAQGLRDAQNRGHTPKSAGAALRRHNEAALVKDIQDLLKSWSDYLSVASGIFLRAPKYNRSVFFGGRGAPLEIKDKRICSLPFATRRATFSEVKRVHDVLSTIQIYDKNVDISSILSPLKRVWQRKSRNPPNPITQTHSNAAVLSQVEEDEQSSEDEGSVQLEMVEVTLGTLDLREHEVKPNKKKRRKRRERKTTEREGSGSRRPVATEECSEHTGPARHQDTLEETPGLRKAKNEHVEGTAVVCEWWEYGLRDALYTACKTGDSETLCTLLQGEEITALHLNTPVDSAGFTLLHVASAAGHKATIRLLLDAGSDPACRDRKGQTPYGVSPDKDTRNTFRKYMAEQPDKYDYTKAQVPGPLTAEIESKKAEKKKAQKVLRRRREREQKEERRRREEEEEERTRFLELSDTEKRALTPQQVAETGVPFTTTRRCWQCGASLLGKVPFEYLHFSFCTTRCVQAHRRANAAPKP